MTLNIVWAPVQPLLSVQVEINKLELNDEAHPMIENTSLQKTWNALLNRNDQLFPSYASRTCKTPSQAAVAKTVIKSILLAGWESANAVENALQITPCMHVEWKCARNRVKLCECKGVAVKSPCQIYWKKDMTKTVQWRLPLTVNSSRGVFEEPILHGLMVRIPKSMRWSCPWV